MIRLLLAGFVLASAALPAVAQSNDTAELVSRIERLERDVRDLKSQIYRGGASSSGTPAASPAVAGEMIQRLDQMESEIQSLTGRIEVLQHGIDENAKALERQSKDVDFRLKALEGKATAPPPADAGGAAEAPPAAAKPPADSTHSPPPGILGSLPAGEPAALPPAAPAQGAPALPGNSPDEQYRYAFNLMKAGDYAQAEPALKEFVREHPKDEHAGNAQYWLGESYYVRGAYQDAANAFLDTVKNYGDGPKGPDALLKLGMSLGLLNQKDNACATLKALPGKYPKASSALKDRAKQEAQRLKCG